MEWFQLLTVLVIQLWISVATRIFYVIPGNSTNASCPSQPCATISKYLFDNGTLPVVSNVQYYFLPGEHHVPANMLLQDLCNLSIIGIVKESPPPVVLVGCSQSYVINVTNSYNVTIANVMFRWCDLMQLKKHRYLTNLLIHLCYSCTMENAVFINSGLKGINLIGKSHFTKITIESNLGYLMFCQGITLYYWDMPAYKDHKHLLIMNEINIIGKEAVKKCDNNDLVGIRILIRVMENLFIVINNSMFCNLHHTAISIKSRCYGSNAMIIENCTFEQNAGTCITDDLPDIPKPLIAILLLQDNKTVIFKDCHFKNNYNDHYLISVSIWGDDIYEKMHCAGPLTNVTFLRCQFAKNIGELLYIRGFRRFCRSNLFIIGPSHFVNTKRSFAKTSYVLYTAYMVVHLIGPVTMSSNSVNSVMQFDSCEVIFQNYILIKSNNCGQVITLQFSFIMVMEYTNITLLKNKHLNELIESEYKNEYKLYPLCIFQLVTLKSITTMN